VPADRVTLIGRDTKHKEGEHPLYDKRVHEDPNEALVANIRTYGNKVAVVLRKNGVHESGPYKGEDLLEVIDGRRRTIACREGAIRARAAGEVEQLLKVEFERSDEATQVGVMISLNEIRQDDTPMNRVRKACYVIASGRSVSEVATMFGVTPQAVKQWQTIIELAPAVQRAIDAGQLTAHAAKQLAGLSQEEQVTKLKEILSETNGKRPTGDQIRQRVKPDGAPKLSKRLVKKLVADEGWFSDLSDDAAAILRFLAGDEQALRKVPGLLSRMKKLSQPKQQ